MKLHTLPAVRRFALAAMFSLAACASNLEHDAPFDPNAPAERQARGSVRIMVALEGEPDGSGVGVQLRNAQRSYAAQTTASGEARITGVVPGTYELVAGTRYFQEYTGIVQVPLAGAIDAGSVTLAARRGTVRGTAQLLDESGHAQGGVVVSLVKTASLRAAPAAGAAAAPALAALAAQGSSDTDGAFELADVPAGKYELVASRPGVASQTVSDVVVTGEEDSVTVAPVELRPMFGHLSILGANAAGAVTRATVWAALDATGFPVAVQFAFDAAFATALPAQAMAATAAVTLAGGDGYKLLYARYFDDLDQVSTVATAGVWLDTLAPAGAALAIDTGAASVNDLAGAVVVTTMAVDANGVTAMKLANLTGATCAAALAAAPAADFAFTANWWLADAGAGKSGPRTVCASFGDAAGNWSSPVSATVSYDTQAPTFTAAVAGVEAVAGRTAQPVVTVTLAGVSADAVEMMAASFASFSGAAWQPVSTSFPFLLVSGDADKTVYVKLRDAAGNESAVQTPTITLDTTGPEAPGLQVADVTGDGFALSSSAVELRWSVPADLHLAGFELQRFVQGSDANFTARAAPGAGTATYTDDTAVTAGKVHNYRIRALDDLGNVSAWSIVASAQPFVAVTEATWVRSQDEGYQFAFNVNPGVFSVSTTYRYDDVTGTTYAEQWLPNQTSMVRAKPAGQRFNERLVVRTANQDNSLVQESELALHVNDREAVDTGGVGDYSSLAVDAAGRIHVAFRDNTNGRLRYAVGTPGRWTVTTANDSVSPFFTTIAADKNGKAHIAYYDYWTETLYYTTNKTGSWVKTTVATGFTGIFNAYPSLALDSAGKVHISYYVTDTQQLKYANNVGGGFSATLVDSGLGSWGATSLALDAAGKAHIGYYDYTNRDLKYATNAGGAWVPVTVDSAGEVGSALSLRLDSAGKAHIAYYDSTNLDLKYATNKTGVWVKSTVDSAGDVGGGVSLCLDAAGRARISYFDGSVYDLKYASNAGGSWAVKRLDTAGMVGWRTSVGIDAAGKVYTSYYDSTGGALKVVADNDETTAYSTVDATPLVGDGGTALAIDAAGASHLVYVNTVNGQFTYATNATGGWAFTTLDTGLTTSSGYPSIAVDAAGKLHVAYFAHVGATYAVRYATNKTGAWVKTDVDTALNGSSGDVHLALKPSGLAAVAYYEGLTYFAKYAEQSTAGTWSTQTVAGGWPSSLAFDAAGALHLTIYNYYFYYYMYDGVSWSNGLVDPNNPYQGRPAQIFVDPTGVPKIAYDDGVNGDVVYAVRSGGGWRRSVVDSAGNVGAFLTGAMDPAGHAYLAYFDQTSYNLKFATDAGGGWLTATLDAAGDTGRYIGLAVDAQGRARVSYFDQTNHAVRYAAGFNGVVAAAAVRQVTPF